MKSNVVKLNSSGKYFQVQFSPYNSVLGVIMVDKKKDATIFQEEGNTIKMGNGHKLKVGKMRGTEFSYFCHCSGIKSSDITVETFDAPEQSLISKDQQRKINSEIKTLEKFFNAKNKSRNGKTTQPTNK